MAFLETGKPQPDDRLILRKGLSAEDHGGAELWGKQGTASFIGRDMLLGECVGEHGIGRGLVRRCHGSRRQQDTTEGH